MFRTISIVVFGVILAAMMTGCVLFRSKQTERTCLMRKMVFLFTLLLLPQKLGFFGRVRKLVYLAAIVCFFVLFVTGFWPGVIAGTKLSGWLLMIHATFAPVFAVCVAILAVMWAYQCRFSEADWQCVSGALCGRKAEDNNTFSCILILQKVSFWAVVVLAIVLIASIVASMFPLFGTDGQEFCFQLHRYSALAFVAAGVLNAYSLGLINRQQT